MINTNKGKRLKSKNRITNKRKEDIKHKEEKTPQQIKRRKIIKIIVVVIIILPI